jgi:hypothetical protein
MMRSLVHEALVVVGGSCVAVMALVVRRGVVHGADHHAGPERVALGVLVRPVVVDPVGVVGVIVQRRQLLRRLLH